MAPSFYSLSLTEDFLLRYELHISKRSRYLRMRISDQGLVVTKPWGVSIVAVEAWLLSKAHWIIRHWQPPKTTSAIELSLPSEIELKALQQTIQVCYEPTEPAKLHLQFKPSQSLILIQGNIEQTEACQALLQTWLKQYAKLHLTKLLRQLAAETGFNYGRCSIKNQQSRWGSCSSRGSISLNAKLLLLPSEWVHYVLIHELCHTHEMNHSPRFWALVARFVPNYREIHRVMNRSMHLLPSWVNR